MTTGDQRKTALGILSSTYVFHIRFPQAKCSVCESRSLCTRSKNGYRAIGIRPRAQYEALQETRKQEKTREWKAEYAIRAGIEGTNSQGIRSFGLRRAKYIGLSKTHLQHILTAAAINVVRFSNWVSGVPLAKTRISAFEAIKPMAA
jgi:transposase